ncbi:Tetratricopeptide repeat domain 27 [Homalodisca vitripennis]|nr:Tetratricopeptide repeat domain 27 [Homalodisca vitripennis]
MKHHKCLQLIRSKLEQLGVKGQTKAWLKSYLEGRSQVEIRHTQKGITKETRSKPLPINRGVPQGSVLGPYCHENDLVVNTGKTKQLAFGRRKDEVPALPDVKLDRHTKSGGTTAGNLNWILLLQKRAVRIISDLGPRESCRDYFRIQKILTVICLYIKEVIMHIDKELLQRGQDIHHYNTHHTSHFHLPLHHTTQFEKKPKEAEDIPDHMAHRQTILLPRRAAEIIRQELEKKQTVNLLCLLGDATDDVDCYKQAWELSGERSGRAQRHWAMYYFSRKQYAESIPHLEKSLSINSLQESLWFRLGYAALDQENWKLCATAYRRYCALEPDCFEAWNNLAKAYVKTGQKDRAYRALQEAVKCNYENWQVWDNMMAVSTDCGLYDEVCARAIYC